MEHPSALKKSLRDRSDSGPVCLQYIEQSDPVRRNLLQWKLPVGHDLPNFDDFFFLEVLWNLR